MSMKLFKKHGRKPRLVRIVDKDNKETMNMENKTETVDNTNTSALVDGKPDTIQVDPMNVAQATIAFMHVQNAELNLSNKKLLAENKILEIMGLAGVSPKEYGYNPSTGVLERQKQKEPVVPEPVKQVEAVTAATTNDTSS